MRILRFTIISGRILKLMVVKLNSTVTIKKKIPVKSEINYPSTWNTRDIFLVCCGRQAAGKRKCNLLDVHSLIESISTEGLWSAGAANTWGSKTDKSPTIKEIVFKWNAKEDSNEPPHPVFCTPKQGSHTQDRYMVCGLLGTGLHSRRYVTDSERSFICIYSYSPSLTLPP